MVRERSAKPNPGTITTAAVMTLSTGTKGTFAQPTSPSSPDNPPLDDVRLTEVWVYSGTMKPNTKDRAFEAQGVMDQGAFGISHADSAHIMTILRDTLYSDKELAVEREYAANAWDANRSAGRGHVPIVVHLPTEQEPFFSVTDNGPGISHEDIFRVFTQYGASTKRGDDVSVGMLGIGSKSGFAYSESFTVTSCHEGMKRVYVAALDETNEGRMNLLHEEPIACGSGITVEIAVKPEDIRVFRDRATKLFVHFDPLPVFNIPMSFKVPEKRVILEHGYLFAHSEVEDYDEHGWRAVMGCVPYKVNLTHVPGIGDYATKISGVLKFDIGEVDINASREELKYSKRTIEAIRTKMDALVDEYVERMCREIESVSASSWEKKLKLVRITHLHLPLPPEFQKSFFTAIPLEKAPFPLQFRHRKVGSRSTSKRLKTIIRLEKAEHLLIDEGSRILIYDEVKRAIAGYSGVESSDLILPLPADMPLAEFEAHLNDYLEAIGVTGIPVIKMSTFTWTPKYHGAPNEKHRKKVFVYDGHERPSITGSLCWETVEDHEPSPDDVFVRIRAFKPYSGFAAQFSQDKALLEMFAPLERLPKVIGYKVTDARPLHNDGDIEGTVYSEWRKVLRPRFLTSEIQAYFDARKRADFFNDTYNYRRKDIEAAVKMLQKKEALGPKHPIVVFLRKIVTAKKTLEKLSKDERKRFDKIVDAFGQEYLNDDDIQVEEKNLLTPYPLLKRFDFYRLWDRDEGECAEWIDYVKLVDQRRSLNIVESEPNNTQPAQVEGENTDGEPDSVHDCERQPELRVQGEELLGGVDDGELQAAALRAAE